MQRRGKGWEKIVLYLEVIAVLVLSDISARGCLALWQRLLLEGVTILSQPITQEPANLPPIGWQSLLSAGQPSLAAHNDVYSEEN